MRARLAIIAIAALGLAALAQGTATAAVAPSSFSGGCAGLAGTVSWPERAITLVPVETSMHASFDGGRCTGMLNGREVQDAPAYLTAALRGTQVCGGGVQTGRVQLTIDGVAFSADATYRRALTAVTVVLEGDVGGSAVVLGRALIDPVDATQRCAGAGLRSAPVVIDELRTLPAITSPGPAPD